MTSTPGDRPERETIGTDDAEYPFGEPGWLDEDTVCPCCGDELGVGDAGSA
ncbi:hypothetical protein [Streptomyces acidiscabies]|uniref:Uncharacterized protein n=1 Tax=Streptomyces acidiscabies TaxID=42234 RepID=A0AAP6BEC3_9ACTN|nr:hypothetical protein [Streptomyces acidiscabies]MBZ3910733.1 hypothetical protein [Streptomyces acidiscabies]MDX2963085.1 hypothetical protein [Streptomyces acidiscabies]MDX3017369.1 hypothetical protein [Streptomyces acidiscabies]MDX3787845.1 hypothetical protein [Streptomyces acidiscabies]GAQ56577.1 hypothetical protein a10_06433 [Streptomyces acidiscabies]